MIPLDFLLQFAATWLVTVVYLACMFGLARRLQRLRAERPDLDAPNIDERGMLQPVGLNAMLGFVFGGRHRRIDDPLTSRLVIAIRILFPLAMVLILTIFVRIAMLSRQA